MLCVINRAGSSYTDAPEPLAGSAGNGSPVLHRRELLLQVAPLLLQALVQSQRGVLLVS